MSRKVVKFKIEICQKKLLFVKSDWKMSQIWQNMLEKPLESKCIAKLRNLKKLLAKTFKI